MSIDPALAQWIANDQSDQAQRIREALRPTLHALMHTAQSFFHDWAMQHDHRRRYVMRRKIRRMAR